jgi:DNA-binding CsgD family transcriptional regulator
MKEERDKLKVNTSKLLEVWKANEISEPDKKADFTKVIDQIASTFAPGSFYYFIFNFETLDMDFVHPSIEQVIGIKPEDFNRDTLLARIHPEDLKRMVHKEAATFEFLLNRIDPADALDYKIINCLRIANEKGEYRKILHQAKTINISKDGKIQQSIAVHTDVTYLNIPTDDKVSFIGLNGRPSYHALNPKEFKFDLLEAPHPYTKQEVKIIELISLGKNSNEIASELNISPHTVKVHKKNVLKKSGAPNSTKLIADCIRKGII